MVNRCCWAASWRGNINQYLMPVLRFLQPEIVFQKANSRENRLLTGDSRPRAELGLLREALGVKIAGGPFLARLGDATGEQELLDFTIIFDEGVFLGS
jgi:hypothetical protein